MSPSIKIAVIGAGPVGLTMGLLLQKNAIPFTLFELRSCPTDEELAEPAGSLDFHQDTGLKAISELGLGDEFNAMTEDCTEQMIIADKSGSILHRDEDEHSQGSRPEISRNKLTQLLLSHFPPKAIRWQHKLMNTARIPQSNGWDQIELDFGPNGKQSFDVVIGADGAWSKVRNLVTDAKPVYSGHQNITLNIRKISTRFPALSKLVGDGSFMALGDRHGIVSQRAVQDTARLYTFISTEDERFATTHNLGAKKPSEIKSFLFDEKESPLRGFGPIIKELVTTACDDETAAKPDAGVDIRPMYNLFRNPEDYHWEHKQGVTLIGDAAHLMPPNGEGVNRGIEDALLLSRAIADGLGGDAGEAASVRETLEEEIKKFEAEMLARSKEVARDTIGLNDMMYGSDNGAERMKEFFESMGPPA